MNVLAKDPVRLRFQVMLAAYRASLLKPFQHSGVSAAEWQGRPLRTAAGGDAELAKALAAEEEWQVPPHPYPGLRSFRPQEHSVFFGRDRHVHDLRERLGSHHIVVVLGGSGSGKSSVIRAGLMPGLNGMGRIRGRDGTWYTAEFRPRLDPVGGLTEALADQVCLPFADLIGERPALAGLLGLPAGATTEAARDHLRRSVRAGFDAAARLEDEAARREAMLDALLAFVEGQLDALDAEAGGGFRSGRPSLLLLIDQLEEVFRPEVGAHAGCGRGDLLNLIVDAHAKLQGKQDSGLFIALAMRSEELHRCTEHPDLAEVVNASAYLLELLDPHRARDREELRRTVVEPVRRVFKDWGLPFDPRTNPDDPFAPGVVDWVIDGVAALSPALEHQPDRLPLLQHALQAMWHGAMKDWSRTGGEADPAATWLRIEKHHLPGQAPGAAERVPDLAATLDVRANDARDEAVALFATAVLGAARHADGRLRRRDELEPGQRRAGDAAVCAAFRALARRDDRGNWARRFAGTAEMAELLRADPAIRDLPPAAAGALEDGLGLVMAGFAGRGYVEAKRAATTSATRR